jgi:PAS domain S-box-containing protein
MKNEDKNKEQLVDELRSLHQRVAELEKSETELKKIEETLRKSEEKYRAILDHTYQFIGLVNVDGTLIEANRAALDFAEIEEPEVLQKPLWDSPGWSHSREPQDKLRKAIKEAAAGKFVRFEAMHPTVDGDNIYANFSMKPILDEDGNVVFLIAEGRDITEHKKIEKTLRENEKKYRELVENANSIIIKMDKKGYISFFNEFAEKFFGFGKEEVIGKNVIGTIVPETESSGRNLQKLIKRIIKYPEAHINNENENITRDGKKVWVAWTNKGIYNAKGEIICILSIGTDISERKHAEEGLKKAHDTLELKVQKRTRELRKSNEKLKNEIEERKKVEEALIKSRNYLDRIINSIADPVFVKDKQHRWVLVNDAFCQLMGYSREELLRKSDYDFLPQHEADIFWEKDEEVLKTNVENVNEEEITDPNGNVHIIDTKKTLYRDISGETYIVAVIRDITELKNVESALRENERKLKIAMDMAKLVNWEYDIKSDVFTFDDNFYALYGTTTHEEGGIKMSSEEYAQKFIPPEESYLVAEEIAKALETNDPNFIENIEHSIIRTDGEKRNIIVRLGVIKDNEGKTIRTYGANQDITELKKAEKELKGLINELKRSNNELQQFAYITSHDLQEPLRTIASFTQLIERRYKGQLDKNADEYIDFIVDAALRMKEMIQGLLDYSRIGARRGKLKSTDIEEVFNHVLANLYVAIKENNAIITHDPLPIIVGNKGQLIQLFQNLIGNAIKFRKKDLPPKIHISCRKDEENNEYVFSVKDNGIGLELQYSDKIFEVFKRLHTIDDYRGVGIGLAIAKRIIERHVGHIWVESELDQGSTFYFTIPIIDEK